MEITLYQIDAFACALFEGNPAAVCSLDAWLPDETMQSIAPYWSTRLGPKKFSARQLSARGGELTCELVGDRVFICGQAVKYLEGTICIET